MRPTHWPLVLALVLAPAAARADEPAPDSTSPDAPKVDPWKGVERPFLYSPDPTAPAPGHVIAAMSVGYAQVNRGAARPFAGDVAHAGAVLAAGAEVGIIRHLSVQAEGLLSGQGASDPLSAGAVAGLGFYPLRAESPVDLAFTGGYLRELGGGNGAWGRAELAGDLGRTRLTITTLAEHVFEPGRDGIDLLVTTGASFAVLPVLRLGAEYVVQDLEGAWDPEEADGGIRHFVGPTMSLELLARRAHLVAGPAVGLSDGSPRLLGRVTALYTF